MLYLLCNYTLPINIQLLLAGKSRLFFFQLAGKFCAYHSRICLAAGHAHDLSEEPVGEGLLTMRKLDTSGGFSDGRATNVAIRSLIGDLLETPGLMIALAEPPGQ